MSVSKKNLNKLLLIWSLDIRASGHRAGIELFTKNGAVFKKAQNTFPVALQGRQNKFAGFVLRPLEALKIDPQIKVG